MACWVAFGVVSAYLIPADVEAGPTWGEAAGYVAIHYFMVAIPLNLVAFLQAFRG